ncbi:MAG: hypothetical protein RI913_995, partial [Pseudomonadota bacterium]
SQYADLAAQYNVSPENVVLGYKKGGAAKQPKQSTPQRNSRGWALSVDAQGNRAYVSPDGTQFEEVK